MKVQHIIGIVLDFTAPMKIQDGYNQFYETKLKVFFNIQVIDETINFQTQRQHEIRPYLLVSILSKTVDQSPKILKIGDLIELYQF